MVLILKSRLLNTKNTKYHREICVFGARKSDLMSQQTDSGRVVPMRPRVLRRHGGAVGTHTGAREAEAVVRVEKLRTGLPDTFPRQSRRRRLSLRRRTGSPPRSAARNICTFRGCHGHAARAYVLCDAGRRRFLPTSGSS